VVGGRVVGGALLVGVVEVVGGVVDVIGADLVVGRAVVGLGEYVGWVPGSCAGGGKSTTGTPSNAVFMYAVHVSVG
jgi:hypothetical protein